MSEILYLDECVQQNIMEYMPSVDTLDKIASFFSVFGDSTRVKIITALSLSDMCVNDMSVVLNLNQTTLSHQLKLLRQNNIVTSFRSGKTIYYSLKDSSVSEVMNKGVDFLIAN